METSVGVPLISMRPFAAAKWSAWLVSKESPRLSGSMPSYTTIRYISYRSLPSYTTIRYISYRTLPSYTTIRYISYRIPCRRLSTGSTQKILGLQKPSVPNIVRRPHKRAGMPAHG